MEMCGDGHDQVCYDARDCPVCEELKKLSDLEDKVEDLQATIKAWEEEDK